jgi:hypothetical protein
MNIYQALSAVMADVGAVRKDSKNQSQGFNFRGIDSVVNAVSPALRKHGVVVFPRVHTTEYSTVSIGSKGTQMGHCRVMVTYTFMAADGTSIESTVAAESMDSGDKATAKAMSVAFRTCLLQTLCLPTDDTDPDAESYERAPKQAAAPSSTASRPAGKTTPFDQIAHKTNSLTNTQQAWILKQTSERIGGTLVAVSDVLGRKIASLDEVNQDEFRPILMALTPKEDNQ